MAIGRGRWFLSTYFKSSLMRPEDWDFLAALVRWARANQAHLVNAWQFGGQPEKREAYGYMFRQAAKDLYCVRNPWIEEQTIELPASTSPTAVDVQMIYPRRAPVGRNEPGERGPTLRLAPYETVFLETVPAAEVPPEVPPPASPSVIVSAAPPRLQVDPAADPERAHPILRYTWSGTLQVPGTTDGELCILVEGDRTIDQTTCRILLDQQPVTPRLATSVGQFAAATEPSPDNWIWFIVPLAAGNRTFQIEVAAAQLQVSVGVYARGVAPAQHDPAPEGSTAFPTPRAHQRAWSQTLQPLQPIPPPAEP
jgi:hypothetical protein